MLRSRSNQDARLRKRIGEPGTDRDCDERGVSPRPGLTRGVSKSRPAVLGGRSGRGSAGGAAEGGAGGVPSPRGAGESRSRVRSRAVICRLFTLAFTVLRRGK